MKKPFLPYTGKRIALRSTPKAMGSRDTEMFPRLAVSFRERGYPLTYRVQTGPTWTRVTVDGFFVPHEIRRNVQRLHRQYIRWVLTGPRREKNKSFYLCSFHEYASVDVLTEHALWWVDLFESAADLLVEYYSLTEADRAEDDREIREQIAARKQAKMLAQSIKNIARYVGSGSPKAKAGEIAEARKRLLAWANGDPDLWHRLSFAEQIRKGIDFRLEVASERQPVLVDDVPMPQLLSPTPTAHAQSADAAGARWFDTDAELQKIRATHPSHPQKGTGTMVKLFKDGKTKAIQTNASDERDFLPDFASALAQVVNPLHGDAAACFFEIHEWLPLCVEICCKLRGYKSTAREERLITAGHVVPQEASLVSSIDDHKKLLVEVPRPVNGSDAP